MDNRSELISVVLVNYKRPKELEQVVQHLKANLPVGEVLIWENNVGCANPAGINAGVYGRWLRTLDAKYSTIFTQDDDCIVHNCAEILASYDGTTIANGLRQSHLTMPRRIGPGTETLIAWGSVFNRDWVKAPLEEYLSRFPEDELLYVQADRIVTTLMRRTPKVMLADVEDFPAAYDPAIAMHLQPGYNEQIAEVRRRLVTFQ